MYATCPGNFVLEHNHGSEANPDWCLIGYGTKEDCEQRLKQLLANYPPFAQNELRIKNCCDCRECL